MGAWRAGLQAFAGVFFVADGSVDVDIAAVSKDSGEVVPAYHFTGSEEFPCVDLPRLEVIFFGSSKLSIGALPPSEQVSFVIDNCCVAIKGSFYYIGLYV